VTLNSIFVPFWHLFNRSLVCVSRSLWNISGISIQTTLYELISFGRIKSNFVMRHTQKTVISKRSQQRLTKFNSPSEESDCDKETAILAVAHGAQNTAPSARTNIPIQASVFFACRAANWNRVTPLFNYHPATQTRAPIKKGCAGNKLTNNSLLWLEISFLRTNRRSRVSTRRWRRAYCARVYSCWISH
jgi:hypothetical protein